MRILHTAESYPPLVSGIPEVVSQLSERLAARGHEVHVATGAVPGSPREEVRNGVHVHRLELAGKQQTGIRGDARPYLELVHGSRWDAVAAHCSQVWSTDLLFDQQVEAPVVFVAHGLSAYKDLAWREYFRQLAEWLRKGKTMVSLSRVGVEDGAFLRDHALPESLVIENGIDGRLWAAPTLGVRERWGHATQPWMVNVSAHSPAKGHGRLFDLMAALHGMPGRPHLTQVGRTHLAHRYHLGRLGVKGGCYYSCRVRALTASGIDLKVNIPRQETVSAVKEADLFVLSSAWEASPLVILESMAAGTPFVTFDVGCVREHVGGYVVADLPEMEQRIRELLADPDLRAELGRQGRQRIAERHDWEVIVDQYEGLYEQLALARPPSAAAIKRAV